MRHFAHVPAVEHRRLFALSPLEFDRTADAATLAVALGATLYMPGNRPRLADDLQRLALFGGLSAVICLEDAIGDAEVADAERNVVAQLRDYASRRCAAPLLFLRVRRPEQIPTLVEALGADAGILSGFVLPKFTDLNGAAFLDTLDDTATVYDIRLLAMPVIESAEVIHKETRLDTLGGIRALLAKHRSKILAVRLGATDFAGAYGIRRGPTLTVYDVGVLADVITDVVNLLGRADGSGYVVTGPVWEYFTPDLDGLCRETALDLANGLIGKTVIHPRHLPVVHALMVVSAEEYADAMDILRSDSEHWGARASSYGNKMNESKPHRAWAERVLSRATAFGVAAENVGVTDLRLAGTPT
ncbi:HpcH/HpaI aldolase/citrate lyase family protein [Dactylosporangium sp. NPDC051484]|uniref:HpcH/HpaI aldolase/citrate lyase family protein n=1 Tax=Dactylosporangium sp. NPDC051484 TaxID=3154942 RepID=UPI00344BBF18